MCIESKIRCRWIELLDYEGEEVNDSEEEDEPTDDEGDEEEETVVNPLSPLPSGSSSTVPPQGDVHDLAKKFPHLRKDLMVLHELKRLIVVHGADTSRLVSVRKKVTQVKIKSSFIPT